MQGSALISLQIFYSLPTWLARLVGNFLFSIILLMKMKENWVRFVRVCLPHHVEEKQKRKRKKLTREAWKEIYIEKMVVMKNRKSVTGTSLSVDNLFLTRCNKYYTSNYLFYSSCRWGIVQYTFTFLIFFCCSIFLWQHRYNGALPGSSSTFLSLNFVTVNAYRHLELLLLVQKW